MTNKEMEDAEDIGLKAVMGNRFTDCTQEAHSSKPPVAATKKTVTEESQEARWEPVRGDRTSLERLESSCKAMLPYSAACAALWYWQIAGALDVGVAQAASTVCAVIAALAAARGWYKP